MKLISPQLGFNNNVKHKGRVFHIQTEDSGVRRPHVITHLFADGGRILKTTKTSYAEHVESANVAETVIAMMKEQHKAMFVALRDGQFDHLFESPARPSMAPPAPGPAPHSAHPEPAFVAPEAAKSALAPVVQAVASAPAVAAQAATSASAPAAQTASRAAATIPELAAPGRPPGERAAAHLAALERAAATAQTFHEQPTHDLPPPLGRAPLADRASRSTRRDEDQGPGQGPPIDAPEPPRRAPAPAPTTGRYAISRPTSIFASSRPSDGASIFGEELISEKSLDEVILSYLADDLGAPPTKK